MRIFSLQRAALVAASFALAQACAAHVVLAVPKATAGTYFKASFMVGHGCDGSPTQRLTLFVPAGVLVAKPQPKSGWKVEMRSAPLAVPGKVHGKPVTEAVSEITWSGGELPDAQFDEFQVLLMLPAQQGPLPFRVLQECASGRNDWAQPAGPGNRNPAPVLQLEAPAGGHAH